MKEIEEIHTQKIVIFKGVIDSLDAFAEELAAALERHGCDVLMVDVNHLRYQQDPVFDQIHQYMKDEHTVLLFLNNIGMLLENVHGGNYWSQSGVRCFDYLADPPFFYDHAIQSELSNVTFLCVDPEHADYINRYYKKGSPYYQRTGNFREARYFPLAGVQADVSVPTIPYEERTIDVMFTGNLRDYKDIHPETDGFADSLKRLWECVYSKILSNTELSIEQSIRACMKEYDLALEDEHVHQILLLFKRMDSIIRARYREMVVTTLLEAGIAVHVVGDGWEQLKEMYPQQLTIHSKVSYRESVSLIGNAKISLNVMPWFKRGFHDRIGTAMLAGCVCVTDKSEYITEHYDDNQNIVLYDLKKLQELPEKIKMLINSPEQSERIAKQGYIKVKMQDTWDQRAEMFLDWIKE
jgi:glycosyltransferase involved in cell wall biosynthesis